MTPAATIGAVVIGRNEGERLVRCLASLAGATGHVVYVDSGSTDGSVAAAQAAGAEVVTLDPDRPFTAARARNAGFARLMDGAAARTSCSSSTATARSATAGSRPPRRSCKGRRRPPWPVAAAANGSRRRRSTTG